MDAILAATDGRSVVEHAFSEVYPNLVRSLTSRLRDRESAEDIAAESFARLAREIAAGRPPEAPVAWLWRVAANLVSSAWRRRAVAERASGWLPNERLDDRAAELAAGREDVARVSAALATLPRSMQMAVLLAAEGATGREIALRIGRSEAATRTLLCRARIRLRHAVEAA